MHGWMLMTKPFSHHHTQRQFKQNINTQPFFIRKQKDYAQVQSLHEVVILKASLVRFMRLVLLALRTCCGKLPSLTGSSVILMVLIRVVQALQLVEEPLGLKMQITWMDLPSICISLLLFRLSFMRRWMLLRQLIKKIEVGFGQRLTFS